MADILTSNHTGWFHPNLIRFIGANPWLLFGFSN
jgi:hypothetical protein